MHIKESDRGVEIITSSYRLLLGRSHGFAGREVEIFSQGRLDRFDRPGEGPHPTCMHFENITVNNTFQLAHYGTPNTNVNASISDETVVLSGRLIPYVEGTGGDVHFKKVMLFREDGYDVDLSFRFEETGPIDYVSCWWDVNDTWLTAMRSSAGVYMPLRVGIGDACGENLEKTWRSLREMDRGAGIWIEMIGEKASILAALRSPTPEEPQKDPPAGGMKYWDGPDDENAGKGVSHGCINMDVINCELSGAQPLDLRELRFAYTVLMSGATVLRQ